MKLAKGIETVGFRKWYERQLLQSHGHMALTFLCAVGVAAAMESLHTDRGSGEQFTSLATVLVCAGTGVWALRRYLFLLQHAEHAANQAECPSCGTYGRLELSETRLRESTSVGVRCRKCGHHWSIND
ncbi:MAG: hypothetical protein ACOVQT_01275 [Rubrivivax sp.]|jgi:DNA-directed RNA polymerase subunit M/transcription elongation factor TFIIS